jgi:MoxR-like ATPase
MDFDEIKEFSAKFENDKLKILEDKKVQDDHEDEKNKKVAEFYEQL